MLHAAYLPITIIFHFQSISSYAPSFGFLQMRQGNGPYTCIYSIDRPGLHGEIDFAEYESDYTSYTCYHLSSHSDISLINSCYCKVFIEGRKAYPTRTCSGGRAACNMHGLLRKYKSPQTAATHPVPFAPTSSAAVAHCA